MKLKTVTLIALIIASLRSLTVIIEFVRYFRHMNGYLGILSWVVNILFPLSLVLFFAILYSKQNK